MKLISFETAKLAKEKGYDNFFSKTLCGELVQAYQYDIVDWLREEHNIDIEIETQHGFVLDQHEGYNFRVSQNKDNVKWCWDTPFSDYCDCLETALQEALKLIK